MSPITRDYREVAHRQFIAYTKMRKPRAKVRRKALRKQLCYLKRDINYIDEILPRIGEMDLKQSCIVLKLTQQHEFIKTVYAQQAYMYQHKVNRVDDRIVSISQPHVRPIVRGKAGKNVEFGAKISLSLSDGFSFIDHLSWDSFNESKDLIPQIEKYKQRYQDDIDRIAVEGRFGVAKRRYGLGLIKSKLKETSETDINTI